MYVVVILYQYYSSSFFKTNNILFKMLCSLVYSQHELCTIRYKSPTTRLHGNLHWTFIMRQIDMPVSLKEVVLIITNTSKLNFLNPFGIS